MRLIQIVLTICFLGGTLATLSSHSVAEPTDRTIKHQKVQVADEKVKRAYVLQKKHNVRVYKNPKSEYHRFVGQTGGRTQVQCGPRTCTCSGIDDCDALFTSTLCAPDTASVTEDDRGECTKNN